MAERVKEPLSLLETLKHAGWSHNEIWNLAWRLRLVGAYTNTYDVTDRDAGLALVALLEYAARISDVVDNPSGIGSR